jgi:peroxiredoxin
MSRSSLLIMIMFLLLANLLAGEKGWYNKANQLYQSKNYQQALEVIDKGLREVGKSKPLVNLKYTILDELKRYNEALDTIDEGIKKLGYDGDLYAWKFKILFKQQKYQQALDVILESDRLSKEKLPWPYIYAADVYLKLKNKEKAFEYLYKAVDRGFISHKDLFSPEAEFNELYLGLEHDPGYKKLVDKINAKIGIGKSAKDFSVELLNGEKFILSKGKGKVIMVDFWATWCPPCCKEIPQLKQYYKKFKARDFEIIGISLDSKREVLKKFIEKEKVPWKIGFSCDGWQDETAKLYGVKSVPSYWLIDRNGVLRHFNLRKEELKEAIAALLAEK